jgi:lipoprotein-releasing system permease protein
VNDNSFAKMIAQRYLWSRRKEAFITIISIISVLGVAIGVMVLTLTMSIMTGFEYELRQKVVGSSHIFISRLGGTIENWENVVDKAKTVKGVIAAAPFTQSQVLISNSGRTKGIIVRGLISESRAFEELSKYVKDKAGLDEIFAKNSEENQAVPSIIIGEELAKNLLIFKDSKISLMTPQVGSTPFGLVPRFKRFQVSHIYSSGLVGYEDGLAFMNLQDAQKFFRLDNAVNGIEIAVSNVEKAPQLANQILEVLGGAGSGYFVQDWTLANKELWEAIKLEKRVYFIVLLLIIVMASFSIISMLIMLVLEKRKDIAVLKTLGARNATIGKIFRYQGATIGFVGVITGIILGYAGCFALQKYGFPLPEKVFPTATVPVKIEHLNFLIVAISAFLICLVSTWYPVRRASSIDPCDVLRYE